jgi:hypothetical protein
VIKLLKLSPSLSAAALSLGLRVAGVAILLAGLATAAWIWRTQGLGDQLKTEEQLADPSAPLAISDSRKQSRQLEIYYGKTGLLVEQWSEDLEHLTHGKPLAKLILVLSCLTAFGCFLTDHRLKVVGTSRLRGPRP